MLSTFKNIFEFAVFEYFKFIQIICCKSFSSMNAFLLEHSLSKI